ncbi:MAG TPA: malto-oligosyltrehalose trehalohydrolase [Gemmatimonadaceae bacterium]|nr:malto-oligosyltrehalose trehalohydrolase [Gemmatimonadaceae bacterium]
MTVTAAAETSTDLWSLQRGANVVEGGVRFAVWAPRARELSVRLCTGDARGDHTLERGDGGVFEGVVRGAAAGDDYKYVLRGEDGGEKERPDPASRFQPHGVHGPSRVVDPEAFEWRHSEGWAGREMADLIIYELHVGAFSDQGTFDGAIPRLAHLVDLGVTAVEIMPVAQFPGERNWGYDGVELYAVQHSYGGPDGLRRLVDAAHAAGLAVILDVVYNHVGPEGNYLGDFGPFFTDRYRTPWGQGVNYDDADSEEVRRFVIDNALHWVTEYRVDGLRLDAIHGIFDFGATHVLRELAEAVHRQGEALGRTAVVIGESDLNDPRVVRPAEEHGYGLDAQWADDLHHAVHAALTGETSGYYADFADGVAKVAAALAEPFVYDGSYSAHRRRRHGAPSTGLPRDRFVVCIQNHDQVGNRAAGERLAALVSPDRLELAAALYLLSPYVPMLWMGEEYGETNPFQYFVSHGDPDLVEAVRKGRTKEFEAFGWGDDVPDPQSEETFRRSKLDWSKLTQPRHAALLARYRELLRLRREEPALRPGAAESRVEHDEREGWITLLLRPRANAPALFAEFNLSDAPRRVRPPDGGWTRIFATGPARAEGDASTLPPHSARLYRAGRG